MTRIIRGRVLLLAGLAAITTACGANSPGTGSASAPPSPSSAEVPNSQSPAAAASPAVTAKPSNFVIDYTAADGTKVSVDFSLYPMVKGGDQFLSSQFPQGAPCPADPQRDAVFAGTLTISNQTPGFNSDVDIPIVTAAQSSGAATLNFGAAYGNGPQCTDVNGENGGYGAMQPAVGVTLNSNGWGPVNIEFVVHDVFSPGSPTGDASVVSLNAPLLSAFEGQPSNDQQFAVTSVSGNVTEGVQGVIRLNLSSLMNNS